MDPEMISWSPNENSWSPLIILCHLVDEEKDDLRVRTMHLLEKQEEPLRSIEPQSWIKERDYTAQDYHDKIQEFDQERNISIALFSQIEASDQRWNNTIDHPKFGAINAEFFLKNWLAHDLLHIKQLTQLRYDHLKTNGDMPIEYAGVWT